jgi:hypothetical protein
MQVHHRREGTLLFPRTIENPQVTLCSLVTP